jgi:hypothetical protein
MIPYLEGVSFFLFYLVDFWISPIFVTNQFKNMYSRIKYIRSSDNQIIVFPETLQHSDFKHFNPVSAGFIDFGVNNHQNPSCYCHGESISLNLKSRYEEDTLLAKRQFNMLDDY